MKLRLDPFSSSGVAVDSGVTQIAVNNSSSSSSSSGTGDSFWEVNTYSTDFLQPIDTTRGLVIGNDLHSSLATSFAGMSAAFNGRVSGTSDGANYFGNFAYGSGIIPLGGLFLAGHAGGTATAPTQTLNTSWIGGLVFGGYSGSAWTVSGANHLFAGLYSQATADTTTNLEHKLYIGGLLTPMISFNTLDNAIKLNESQLDSDITAYFDTGIAFSSDGATGIFSAPQGIKTIPRVTSITSSATPTINTDTCDFVTITALATAITSMTTNLSGTPANGQTLKIRIKDDGTPRAITWGASFVSEGATLPTSTTTSKVTTVGLIYDTVKIAWGCVAVVTEA